MRSPAPRGRKENLAKFRLRSGTSRGNLSRSETEVGLGGVNFSYSWTTICSSALHGGAPPRPPPFNCMLFRTGIRSCTALALHVAVMDSAVPSLSTLPAACCFRSIRSGLQQVRFLRKLMPGKGFYMDVLCYLLKAWKRCAVPAAIASCRHGCSCALLASCLSSLTRYGAVLSSCIPCRCLLFASQSRAPQGRLKSPKFKSGLYTKFQDQGFW